MRLRDTPLYRAVAVGLSRAERIAMGRELQRVVDHLGLYPDAIGGVDTNAITLRWGFTWERSPQGSEYWIDHVNRLDAMRKNDLSLLPNRAGYRFVGITRDGQRINCVVKCNERREHYVVDEDNELPCFKSLSHWTEHYRD